MSEYISAALVRERIACCKSRLDEINKALSTELEKPMHHRDPLVLTFLESQRQKFAFSIATLSELFDADSDVGTPIAIQSE